MLRAIELQRSVGGKQLLDGVTLNIEPGDRIALSGASGSGKTVLLRALALLDAVDTGEIHWEGSVPVNADVPRYRSQVMYVHQRAAVGDGTVEDLVRFPFSLSAYHDRSFDVAAATELLERLGRSAAFLRQRQVDLSGGEAQLAALVRALLLQPKVLLLDEPTSALDPKTTTAVEQLIRQWVQGSDRAYVWITHDVAQTTRVGTRRITMQDGVIQFASEGDE